MPTVTELLEKRKELQEQVLLLNREISRLERAAYDEARKFGGLYGRCIKELKCDHQSDYHNCSDSTTIKVGDVIQFDKDPVYNSVTFYPNGGEYFEVETSEEYFELFRSDTYVETKNFNGD